MKLTITPGYSLKGTLGSGDLPGDKSLSHRAALLAALAQGESHIENFLVSGVTRAMLDALAALGVAWKLAGKKLTVQGGGIRGLCTPENPINCGNSATTLRLLAGALSASGMIAVLDGSPGLRRRPMNRIVEPLQAMGVPIAASGAGTAPLKLGPRTEDRPLKPLQYNLPVASAQVKSCLLLAALAAQGTTVLREPGPSRDHTERMLHSMGVTVQNREVKAGTGAVEDKASAVVYETSLTPPDPCILSPLSLALPADISAAAFLIVAALITPGSEIVLKGVGLNPGRTGLLDALLAMGADIVITTQEQRNGEPVGDLVVRSSRLTGAQVSGPLVVRMIDEFPAFAVAASIAQGDTLVRDAAELRYKESDRISALCQELRSLGGQVDETPDGFRVRGGRPLRGGSAQAFGDHRLAMSLALVGLVSEHPVSVSGAEMIDESFPEFAKALSSLGADVQVDPGHG